MTFYVLMKSRIQVISLVIGTTIIGDSYSYSVMCIGHGGTPGIGTLLNILLPLAAGATVHAVEVLSSFPSIPAVGLCLFSLVEPSCLSAGQFLGPYPRRKVYKTVDFA